MSYRVQSGDSMSAIASRLGVSLAALERANPQIANPNTIYPGQVLNVPGRRDTFTPPSGPRPQPPSGGQYRVVPGDTLGSIASRHGVSLGDLERANPGIKNPNLIFVGEMISIPGGHAAPPPGVGATGATQGPPRGFQAGAWGGQCLAWVNKTSGRPMWNFDARDCLTNHPGWTRVSSPQPGDLFVMASGKYGHIGYVLGVNSDGTVTVADSNWNLDERMHEHRIPMSYMAGYLR